MEELDKEIEKRLLAGDSKEDIWQQVQNKKEPGKALFHLNNKAALKERVAYQYLNLGLALTLGFMTAKELITLFSFGRLDIPFLTGLVVPIINIYILKEILRFHRLGYQYLFVLTSLSLILPKNHAPLELTMSLVMIATSGFLYLKLFPKGDQVKGER